MHAFRLFIASQIKLSEWFDCLIPAQLCIDGYGDFKTLVNPLLQNQKNQTIYDIGGGKNPYITKEIKVKLDCKVIGIDIDSNELNAAPDGLYDNFFVADITDYDGNADGNLAICITLLEHVKDVEAALVGIRSCLKHGGYCALFVPSKNALFAKINKILPNQVKKYILFSLYPNSKKCQGFPAYYDRCTPVELGNIAQSLGFEILDEKYYFKSSYFSFFFPFYFFWRIYILIRYIINKKKAAETFAMVLKKR